MHPKDVAGQSVPEVSGPRANAASTTDSGVLQFRLPVTILVGMRSVLFGRGTFDEGYLN